MPIEQLMKKFGVEAVEEILSALDGLGHGNVNIIVQDSKIVQIDRVEKVRLSKPTGKAGRHETM